VDDAMPPLDDRHALVMRLLTDMQSPGFQLTNRSADRQRQ
jgi:hypothetical protein